jgi:FKBP-type peptidyl-prolyl cis-trans isomerase
MKKLSTNETIAVWVTLIVAFGMLFFGNRFFKYMANPTQEASVSTSENLSVEDVQLGEGEEVKSGDTISVHYVGKLSDGTQFDSSIERGEPLKFVVGEGMLIKGFDQGVIGMKLGGKRRLVIPPELGYGDQQVGPIPANSTIVFDVELVKIEK